MNSDGDPDLYDQVNAHYQGERFNVEPIPDDLSASDRVSEGFWSFVGEYWLFIAIAFLGLTVVAILAVAGGG